MKLNIHQKIDKTIYDISKRITILTYVEATNSQEEKEKFLAGKTKKPQFEYRPPYYNTEKIKVILTQLKPPRDKIGNLLKEKILELQLKNKIVENLGNEKVVRAASKHLYSEPREDIVEKALVKLEQSKGINEEEDRYINAKKIVKHLKKYLDKAGIGSWKVKESDQSSVSVGKRAKIVKVSTHRKYSRQAIDRLKVHEINVHALRTENGKQQNLHIFGSGLPNYLRTEEGLAAYLEEKFDVASPISNVRFPLRVIAVKTAHEGATFKECFDKLKAFGLNDELCWETTYRAFRGGGFLKDHIYLEGYYEVKDFLENGGNLEDLYIGKIGLEHLELCKELMKNGVLKPPKYLPESNL